MPGDFDAFSTELRLALLTLKNEVSKEIRESSAGVLTEVRERLGRHETERGGFYKDTREKLETIEDLARETNGQVIKHKTILFGEEGAQDGLISQVKSNTKWRNALVSAGGVVTFFAWIVWIMYGDDIRSRGMINRPAEDYKLYIDERIHQWIPEQPKPVVPPPALDGKKVP